MRCTPVPRRRRGLYRLATERGNVLFTVLGMTLLLGVSAMSVDIPFMYDKRNRMHAAADAAAKSAAIEVHRGNTTGSNLQAYAAYEVGRHGFASSTLVGVYNPPISGPRAGNSEYVEVVMQEPTPTFFGMVLGFSSLTPRVRAVAGTSNGTSCIYVDQDLRMGNTQLELAGCGVHVGDDFIPTNPNAEINPPDEVGIADDCEPTTGGAAAACTQGFEYDAPPQPDPLAWLPSGPTAPTPCTAVTVPNNTTATVSAGCHSSLTIGTNSIVNFSSGVHYFTGPLTGNNNVRLNGTNLMFYFASGSITLGNFSQTNLSAQVTSDWMNGITIYQARGNTSPMDFGNNGTVNVSGAIYAISATVTFANSLGSTNDCTLFVAHNVNFTNGNTTYENTCSAYGGSPLETVTLSE